MDNIINLLRTTQQNWDAERYNLIQTKEKAVMDLYKIRNYIDDQIKRKVPFDTILVDVHKQLIQLTPHGPNMIPV